MAGTLLFTCSYSYCLLHKYQGYISFLAYLYSQNIVYNSNKNQKLNNKNQRIRMMDTKNKDAD